MSLPKIPNDILRHTSAARAFHTGLIADTQRLRIAVNEIGEHLGALRRRTADPADRLSAAEASCRHMKRLRECAGAWLATYRDLHASVRRVRDHLKRLAKV